MGMLWVLVVGRQDATAQTSSLEPNNTTENSLLMTSTKIEKFRASTRYESTDNTGK
jgi:hypothetical protein